MNAVINKAQFGTSIDISGTLGLSVNGETRSFAIQPYKDWEKKVIIGVFDTLNPNDVVFVKDSPHFKAGRIWLRSEESSNGADIIKTTPVLPKKEIVVINPLNLTPLDEQALENAEVIEPKVKEIILENIRTICKRLLEKGIQADNIPKQEFGNERVPGEIVSKPIYKGPVSLNELKEMSMVDLKAEFKASGYDGKYDVKKKKEVNAEILYDWLHPKPKDDPQSAAA